MYGLKKERSAILRPSEYVVPFIRNRGHVATCSAASVWCWSQLTGSSLIAADLIIVPVIMVCIYQWNRLYDLDEDLINSPVRAKLTILYKVAFKYLCPVGTVLVIILALHTGSTHAVIILITVVFLGFLYSTPFVSITQKRLKNLTVVKNLTSALGWTLLVVFYPAIHAGIPIGVDHWISSFMMFAAVWMVELIWDVRDQEGDAMAGVQTIPVLMGVDASRRWILIINSFSVLILLIGFLSGVVTALWLFLLLNNILIYGWVTWNRDVLHSRDWSHSLVGLQTVLLVLLGLYAV